MSIVAYAPDDLTVTVTADTTLAALQEHLGQRGQWLPVDPPHPEHVTAGEIVDRNLSGPRRYGHGTIREHLLGIRAQLADGRTIKNGGAVVENAAGDELCRLFTGARGELGPPIHPERRGFAGMNLRLQDEGEAEQGTEVGFVLRFPAGGSGKQPFLVVML